MKKDFLQERKEVREDDPKLLGKRTRIVVNNEFIDTLIDR